MFKIPNEALVHIIQYCTPESLYWLYTKQITGCQLIQDNIDEIISLLKSPYCIALLCQQYQLNSVNTFSEFISSWNFWYLDTEVTPEYFCVMYKSIPSWIALYTAGRNARTDKNWLTVVNYILNSEMLWCSEYHITKLCRGLSWSLHGDNLIKIYKQPLVNYLTSHSITLDILYPIDEECNQELSILPHNYTLNFSTYHITKLVFDKVTRKELVRGSMINDDIRLILAIRPTASEIQENSDLTIDNLEKAKYIYSVCPTFSFKWYTLFHNNRIADIYTLLESDSLFAYNLMKGLLEIDISLFDDYMVECIDDSVEYRPDFIQYFCNKINITPELKISLLNLTRGDELMTRWINR